MSDVAFSVVGCKDRGCHIPTSVEQVHLPPPNRYRKTDSVRYLHKPLPVLSGHHRILRIYSAPPQLTLWRISRKLCGRIPHKDRLSDLSISSSYRISIILNGCLVYEAGMLMQAPLTSTTKSCSLGCICPPPFTFGEVVDFQFHTLSQLLAVSCPTSGWWEW